VLLTSERQPAWTQEAFRLGVRALLSRDASAAEILAAVEAAASGLAVVDPRELETWLASTAPAPVSAEPHTVTARELEAVSYTHLDVYKRQAVLKVDGNAVEAPVIAAAEPVPGNLALSIGRSPDSGVNATMGIVSAVSGSWRTWRGGRLDRYIRLDLTLYPGSSGGLVVNTKGEAIGIATSALSRIAGLAIPASTVDHVVEEILSRGHVARGYLGVGLQPVELPDHHKGLIVLSLEPEGPAAKAGVLIGDVVVSLAGTAVDSTDDIQTVLEKHAVGQTVLAGLVRGGVALNMGIVIGERSRRN